MKKMRNVWIPITVIAVLCVISAAVAVWMGVNGYGITVGRALTTNGQVLLIDGDTPIVMSNRSISRELFSDLADGDRILVVHDGIACTYPAQTGAYTVLRLSDGGLDDIPDTVITQLSELGWEVQPEMNLPEELPEDFSFALRWGTFGISSYESKTGKLVKTTDATHPEDYVTAYQLSEEETADIYDMLRALDINDYPTVYNPNEDLATCPSMSLILTVHAGGTARSICAEGIAFSYETNNKKGQRFLTVCREIIDRLTATAEWQALPDYEFLYD